MLCAPVIFSAMPRKTVESEKKIPVTARIDPKLVESLSTVAREDRRTLSFMVEDAIRFFLDHRTKPKKR